MLLAKGCAKSRRVYWAAIFWSVLSVVFLCACENSATQDATFTQPATFEDLDQESCLVSIKPGVSTDTELISALRSCQTVMHIDSESQIEGTQSTAHGWQLSAGRSGFAVISNGLVVFKSYAVGRGIPLGKILSTYGAPDYAWRTEVFNPDKCIGLDRLLYLMSGLAFEFVKEYPCDQDITIDSNLNTTRYSQFAPGQIDDVLKRAYFQKDTSIAKSELRAWTGYDSMKRTPTK